jgi:hypothetical protein
VRSQQVFKALEYIPNRFSLCRITSVAIKRLHKVHTRPQDTISNVLGEIDRYRSRRPRNSDRENVLDTKTASVQVTVILEDEALPYPEKLSIDSDLVFTADLSAPILEAD